MNILNSADIWIMAMYIDNNLVENSVRPFVLGRKNWLFSDIPEGAEASAFYFSP